MKVKKRNEKPNIKRRHSAEGNKTSPSDKHHNRDTPCSNLIRDVVAEIFPQAAAVNEEKTDNDTVQTDCNSKTPTVPETKEQPLLGSMIQAYLIQQHLNNKGPCNSSETNGKSAKKKKKKKKKQGSKVEANGNGEVSAVHEEDGTSALHEGGGSCDRNTNNGKEVANLHLPNNGKPAAPSQMPQSPSVGEFTMNNNSSPSSHKATPSPLDCFLDSLTTKDPFQHTNKAITNRNIESFAAYLTQKYETCILKPRNNQKNKKKDEHPELDLMDILPTISIEDLKSHAGNVDCRPCQTSANSQLKQLMLNIHPTNNVLPWGIHVEEPPSQNECVFVIDDQSVVTKKVFPLAVGGLHDDQAFDYVNMDDDLDLEAGAAPIAETLCPSRFRLEFHPIRGVTNEDNVKFLQIKPLVDGDGELFPLPLDNIVNLVKSVILPCGMELKGSNDFKNHLSDKEFDAIVESARQLCNKHIQALNCVQNSIGNGHILLAEARSTTRQSFDPKTSASLNSCDEVCEAALKAMGEFLTQITKMSCLVGWSNEYGPGLMECMVDCWSQFNVTLDKLIQPTMKYRGGVLQLCNRPGQVPMLSTSKMIRSKFTEYLETKLAMVEKLYEFLDGELINNKKYKSYRGSRHQAPSPLVRLCILEAFMSHLYKSQDSSDAPSVFQNDEDEYDFKKLLLARIVLSQHVIKSPTRDNIEAKEKQHFSEVKALYASIVKTVVVKESDYETSPDFIKQCHDRYALERSKAERQLESEPKEYTPELITSLMNTSRLLSMQWIYLLCMRQSYLSIEFALPSRLEEWMESISGSEISQTPLSCANVSRCDGSGGKRRVASVLAVLLYRWLEARCSEWHAELTQAELLTAVDFDDLVVNDGETKSGKKKKNKKKHGGPVKSLNLSKESSMECNTSQLKDSDCSVAVDESSKSAVSIKGNGDNQHVGIPYDAQLPTVDKPTDDETPSGLTTSDKHGDNNTKHLGTAIENNIVVTTANPTTHPLPVFTDNLSEPIKSEGVQAPNFKADGKANGKKKKKAKKAAANQEKQIVCKTSSTDVPLSERNESLNNVQNAPKADDNHVGRSANNIPSATTTKAHYECKTSQAKEDHSGFHTTSDAHGDNNTKQLDTGNENNIDATIANPIIRVSTNDFLDPTKSIQNKPRPGNEYEGVEVPNAKTDGQNVGKKKKTAKKGATNQEKQNICKASLTDPPPSKRNEPLNNVQNATKDDDNNVERSAVEILPSTTTKAHNGVKTSQHGSTIDSKAPKNPSSKKKAKTTSQQAEHATEAVEELNPIPSAKPTVKAAIHSDVKPAAQKIHAISNDPDSSCIISTGIHSKSDSHAREPPSQIDPNQTSEVVNQTETDTAGVILQMEPNVGVIDNGKVISAEDFLVGRMEAVLAEIEEVKSRYTLWF